MSTRAARFLGTASAAAATLLLAGCMSLAPQYERPALFNAALRRHLERNAGAGAK